MENKESTKWLRDGHTIYSLMHAGFRKGKEQFKNRFYFHVYADAEVTEAARQEATAKIHEAVASYDAVCAQNAELLAALKVAERYFAHSAKKSGHECLELVTIRAAIAHATGESAEKGK